MNSIAWKSPLPITSDPEIQGARKLAVTAMLIVFAGFFLMVCLGIMMRANQGQWVALGPTRFYSLMTLHGLMMVGALWVGALYGAWYVLVRHTGIRPYTGFMWVMLLVTVLAVVELFIGTLVGEYGVGWYMLYPLEFSKPAWPMWSMVLTTIALMQLGVVWLATLGVMLYSMGKRYGGFGNILGLQYLTGKKRTEDLPPIVLITTVIAIDAIIGIIPGALFLLSLLVEWIDPSIHFNVLGEKNLVFFFGHVLANITLYFLVGIMYELMPRYTGRPWKCNKVVVYSWLATFGMVITVYSHHLYMDFAQPVWLEYLGQIFSYGSGVPSTVVTVFGLIAQIYRLGVKHWSFVPATFALGTVGWISGGFAAIIDSTISNNLVFHNTLWVNAHFHTYYLEGVLIWLCGYGFYLVGSRAERLAKSALALMVVFGYLFLLMFYLGGVFSVPRRYSDYATTGFANHVIANHGTVTAEWGAVFAALFLLGFIVYLVSLGFLKQNQIEGPASSAT